MRLHFNKLTGSFRSILHAPEGGQPGVGARPGAPERPEIVPSSVDRPPDRSWEPAPEGGGERTVDPLELALSHASTHAAPVLDSYGPTESSGRTSERGLSLEAALVEAVVRRVSWGGDRRRGVARIELDGVFSGTTIWVRNEGRAVELEVSCAPGVEASELPERLLRRLGARGLDVAKLEVR